MNENPPEMHILLTSWTLFIIVHFSEIIRKWKENHMKAGWRELDLVLIHFLCLLLARTNHTNYVLYTGSEACSSVAEYVFVNVNRSQNYIIFCFVFANRYP